MSARYVLILAGGRGERFWPWSQPARPKQLLPLASGGRTLLRATFDRATRLVPADRILIMTSLDLRDACARECPGACVLGEPSMRNTAHAIAAALAWVGETDAIAVMPADHAIEDEAAFAADLELAFARAERERVLMTFGIRPASPETNFGYIERGTSLSERIARVARFTEKPDLATANAWVANGTHVWNSGIFVWRRDVFFDALEAGRPAIAAALRKFSFTPRTPGAFSSALRDVFEPLESISVDYAVLERAPNTLVIDASFDWDDLGSWSAWARRQRHDASGNVLYGDAIAIDCERCVVVGDGGTAAALGLRDMVVVHANGATLACRLEDSDRVRSISAAARERSAG
jgi:mannose-1-phosphate guanylyltransferase/mannose-6-phosphate isomerase